MCRLERFNRTIRRRTRPANVYHSETDLKAMMSRELRYVHDEQSVP